MTALAVLKQNAYIAFPTPTVRSSGRRQIPLMPGFVVAFSGSNFAIRSKAVYPSGRAYKLSDNGQACETFPYGRNYLASGAANKRRLMQASDADGAYVGHRCLQRHQHRRGGRLSKQMLVRDREKGDDWTLQDVASRLSLNAPCAIFESVSRGRFRHATAKSNVPPISAYTLVYRPLQICIKESLSVPTAKLSLGSGCY